ncbi:cytochrome P450 [Alternaria alternata]|nr:cytochrome P450 [Alternaria alternata]
MSSDGRGVLLPDMPTSRRVLLALCALALGHNVRLAIYRVYWHLLRRFPALRWYVVSELPAFYLTGTGQRVAFLERVYRGHGDVVHIAAGELSTVGADAWKDTHGRSAKHGVRKTPVLRY